MIDIEKFVFKGSVEGNVLIRTHLRAFKAFGYMLFEHQRFKRVHCFRGVVFTVSFILFNIAQYVDLFSKLHNVNELAKNASTTLLFTTMSFRMINFYWNRTRYVNIVKTLDAGLTDAFGSADGATRRILDESVRYMRRLTKVFWIIALITANGMCIKSAIEGVTIHYRIAHESMNATDVQPPLILPSWFPFDDLWQHFWIAFICEYYIMVLGMLIVPCWHSFIVSIMVYIIINLKILNHELCNVREGSAPEFSNAPLVKCVNDRERLYGFVKELSSLISSALFLDFIIFSLLLCMLLFQASLVGVSIQLIIIACYIITMTTILWMYYNHANEITFYADQLTLSTYKCKWYEYSQRFRKQVLITMTAMQPIMLQAGFIDMKLDTFLSILRASYSYFTLLTQIAEK